MEDVLARIRRKASRIATDQEELARLALEASTAGKSLREIAAAARMSPEGVRKMVARAVRQADRSDG